MHKLHAIEWGQDAPPKYALLLRTKCDRSRWSYWQITGIMVLIDPTDGTPRNLSGDQPMQDITVSALMGDTDYLLHPYSWQVEAKPTTVRLEDAKRIASTLTVIHKGLDRLYDRFGSADSLGAWVSRVMDVCGIEVAMIQTKGDPDGWYDRGEYRTIERKHVPVEVEALVKQGRIDLGIEGAA